MTLLRLPVQPTGELVQSPAPLGGQSVRFVVGDYLGFGCIYEVIRASVCTALLRNPRRIQVAPSIPNSIMLNQGLQDFYQLAHHAAHNLCAHQIELIRLIAAGRLPKADRGRRELACLPALQSYAHIFRFRPAMIIPAIPNQTPATAASELDTIDPIQVDTMIEQPITPLADDHTYADTEKIIVLDSFVSANADSPHGNLVAGVAAAASQHTELDQIALMQTDPVSALADVPTAINDALQQILESDTSARVVNISKSLTPAYHFGAVSGTLLATSTTQTAEAVVFTRAAVAEKLGLPHDASSAEIKAAMSASDTPPETEWAAFKDAKAAHLTLTSTIKTLAQQIGLPEDASQKDVLTELVNQAEKVFDDPAMKQAEQELASTVQALHDKGISVVIAAGNDGIISSQLRAFDVPFNADAFNDNVLAQGPIISVGATIASDDSTPASFTNPSGEVDVAADGVDILFANGVTQSGTSFATPVIAGLVADLYAINPALTPDKVINILQQAAQPNPDAADALGAGLINLGLARELARNA